MTMQDTYKWGSIYVDASLTIDRLEDEGAFSGESREALRAFEESDPDYTGVGSGYGFYGAEDGQLPLVLIGMFGGYPGEALDEANLRAAKEWAEGRDNILTFSSWFGGCEMVSLWFDLSSSVDDLADAAQEAVDLAEGFRDYPVLDEELYCQIERENWDDMIQEMIKDAEDDHGELSMDHVAKIWELAGEFYGYWGEGHFDQDEWDKIIDKVLTGEVQLHQDDKLI